MTTKNTENQTIISTYTGSKPLVNNVIRTVFEIEKDAKTNDEDLNSVGIQLKRLLRNDYNNIRIKNATDIEDYMLMVSKSLYPTNEKTIKNIYTYSENGNEPCINDLKVNYKLTTEYLQAFKTKMMNECDKLIHEAKVKQVKLKKMENKKIEDTIAVINKSESETKIETDCLYKISTLPDEIIGLIGSFTLTNDIRLKLLKSKYDSILNNIMMKLNVKTLNKFIEQYVKMNNGLFQKIDEITNGNLDDLFKEYQFSRYKRIHYSTRKSRKITNIITELEDKYKFIYLLQNMTNSRYINTQNYFKDHLIHCYQTCIYISNKSIENSVKKRNIRKQTKATQSTQATQQTSK